MESKVSKKNMSLQAWVEKEFELKKEFLNSEASRMGGCLELFPRDNCSKAYIPRISTYPQIANSSKPIHFQNQNLGLSITVEIFELLKQRFRIFKFQKKNKTEDRVKLQIHLKKKTYLQLEKISKENSLKDTSDCLDFLTNEHETIQQKHNKEVETLRAELRNKEDEIGTLQYSLSIYKKAISNKKNNKKKSRDDLVDYLTQVAIKATCKIAQYESFINNQPNFNAEVVPLLSQEEIQKIKSEFEKELEQIRLVTSVLNSDLVEGIDNFM